MNGSTVRDSVWSSLVEVGLSYKEADHVTKLVETRVFKKSMRGKWNRPENSESIKTQMVLSVGAWLMALEWMKAECPNHDARSFIEAICRGCGNTP